MKIRIRGNSVRFRLTKSEVEQIKTTGFFQEDTDFGNTIFTYRLEKKDIKDLTAEYNNNCITIYMPTKDANEWYDIERIGYENEVELKGGKTLRLLIEKDFVCLDETVEDQSDNYAHPLESKL